MDIPEYQAKELLSEFGVAVPPGGLAYSPEQAQCRAQEIGGDRWVVKGQVHAGARGRAGGIIPCRTDREVHDAAASLLGRRLVTAQTGPAGKGVYRLYVEQATDVDREMYLGFVLDRARERVAAASRRGGMSVEETAAHHPGDLLRVEVEPAVGMQPLQARQLAFHLGTNENRLNGGDPINGSSFRDILELFEHDADTSAVLLIGEIAGPQEAEAADYIGAMSKPVAARARPRR